jgi:hypothetical protein
MKKLAFVSLFAAGAALATGCVAAEDDDPGVSPCDDAELDGGACLDVIVECPPDATGFTIEDGSGIDEDFACGDYSALVVDAGSYEIIVTPTAPDIEFRSDSGTITLAEFDVGSIEFTDWGTDGYLTLSWTIAGDMPDAAGCTDVDGDSVSTIATVSGDTEGAEDLFDCTAGFGTTDGLPLGDYVVAIALLNTDEESVADAEPQNVTLASEDELFDLGNFNFEP